MYPPKTYIMIHQHTRIYYHTHLGAATAFPTRPLANIMLLAKAPFWVKALAEHATEAVKAIANKVLLANMVKEYLNLFLEVDNKVKLN